MLVILLVIHEPIWVFLSMDTPTYVDYSGCGLTS